MRGDALLVVKISLLPVGNRERRLTVGPTRSLNGCEANTPPREDPDCRIEWHGRRQSIGNVLALGATAEYPDLRGGIETCGI
jgi:hypothetical protein